MNPWWIATIIILAVLIIATIVLYVVGNKMQKKQVEQRRQMEGAAQPVTMMIIDKKYIKMKDANLPKIVMDSTPKRYQKAKVPVVKAKVGPQIMSLICDDGIFDQIPDRGEVKAMVSGIYIIRVKNIRGKFIEDPTKKKKKGFGQKMRNKQMEYKRQLDAEASQTKESAAEKARRKKSEERASKISDRIK